MATEIGGAPAVSQRIRQNAAAVAAFLAQHPAVDGVWWAESSAVRERFAAVRAPRGGSGAIVTFTLRGTGGTDFAAALPILASFYDRIHAPTLGTSWGTAGIIIASMLMFTVTGDRAILHEFLIGAFVMITTPVTLLLLGRAAIHRDRVEQSANLPKVAQSDD